MGGLHVNLGTRIVAISVGSIFLTASAGLLVQRSLIRRQGIAATQDAMRAVILDAENARNTVSGLRAVGAFDETKLAGAIKDGTDYRQTAMYQTVPVVAAWNSIGKAAKLDGYEFRIAAHAARNPENVPKGDDERILQLLEGRSQPEYSAVDEKTDEIVYARPVLLSGDCMMCHGDASLSPNGNGKDLLGFRMEGWKPGDVHGMFVLRAKMERVDSVVHEGLLRMLYWLFPLAIVIGLGVYWMISRLSGKLQILTDSIANGSSEMTSAAAQISAQSQNLARGASQQAGSLEETSAAAEQITAMTRKNGDHARQAAEEMDRVSTRVVDSDRSLSEMIGSMQEINDASGKIAKIIKVIDEISFQTNILALNAAVEAARAGDAGAGFAVVAEEVRNLAMRSANAAKDTASLIEDSLSKSDAGREKLGQVVAVFSGISESAARVKLMIDEVSLGSEEQTRGIEQVLRAIQEMDKLTQASAANAEEGAATSQQLSAQADAMHGVANELKMVVQG
jgi:methyl-accepting chemotaxis protein